MHGLTVWMTPFLTPEIRDMVTLLYPVLPLDKREIRPFHLVEHEHGRSGSPDLVVSQVIQSRYHPLTCHFP